MSLENRDYMRDTLRSAKNFSPSAASARLGPFVSGRYGYLLYSVIFLPFVVALFATSATTPYSGGYPLAIIAFAFHMGAGWFFFGREENRSVVRALQTAAFTGIVGMGFLFAIQHFARTDGLGVIGRFIAYAYGLTDQSPFSGNTPLLTFIGYVLSVGLLEEGIKAIPVVFLIATGRVPTWQLACLVGFASGIGFGVAEGIWYHESVYNQPLFNFATLQWNSGEPTGFLAYLIRFFSCAGLHGIYAATAAMLIFRRYERFGFSWENALQVLWPISGVICIHALYDSLLAFDHGVAAFFTDFFAFLWFVLVVEISRGTQIPSPVRIGFYATAAASTLIFAVFAASPSKNASIAPAAAQGTPNPTFAPPGVDLINQGLPIDKLAVLTDEQKRTFEKTVHDLGPRIDALRGPADTYFTQHKAVLDLQSVIADVRVSGAKPRVIVEQPKDERPAPVDARTHNPFDPSRLPSPPRKRVETLSRDKANELINEMKKLWQEVSATEEPNIVTYFPEIGGIQQNVLTDRIMESDVKAVEAVLKKLPPAEEFIARQRQKMDRLIEVIQMLGYDDRLTDPRLGPAIAEKPSQVHYDIAKQAPAIQEMFDNQTAEQEERRRHNEEMARVRQQSGLGAARSREQTAESRLWELPARFDAALTNGQREEAYVIGKELSELARQHKNTEALRKMAASIVKAKEEMRDLDFALLSAEKANELSGERDVYVLGTLADVHFLRGDIDKAIVSAQQARKICHVDMQRIFEAQIDRFKKFKASASKKTP